MKKELDLNKFVTKKELEKHKKEVEKMISNSTKHIKKWDIKQDKAMMNKK